MSDGNKTYEEWMKCTGVFCELCKKEIAKYEIALRRACASESPKFCCDCAIDLCEQQLVLLGHVRSSSSNPSFQGMTHGQAKED